MIKSFLKILTKKIDATGLSIFRIFYSLILFFEILQLYIQRGIMYGQNSIWYFGELNPEYIFKFWFIIVGLLILGLFTRTAAIINYLFSVIIFSSAGAFEYHVFYAYVGLNFFMIFMPVSRVLSLDSLLQKIKYSDTTGFYKPDSKVLAINYFVPILAEIALVYFDSILYKFTSPMWVNGLGMWLPGNLPMITWNSMLETVMNMEWLVKFLGWLVIIFETLFLFLFWFKPFRIPLLIIGVFFHFGIHLVFPIPWFAFTVIAVYLLLVPVSWWRKIGSIFKSKTPRFKFYYDKECPLCVKTIVIIRHFDIFNLIDCLPVQGNYKNEKAFAEKTEMELLINIHGVSKSGKVYVGYDAYSAMLRAMVYTYPFGLVLSLPIINNLGKKVYAYVAGNRLTERCTTETCLMPVIQRPISESQDFLVEGWNKLNISKVFWICFVVFILIMQGMISWFSPLTRIGLEKVNLKNSFVDNVIKKPYDILSTPLIKYFGIGHHPVFMDRIHFDGYNHIIKTEYVTDKGEHIIVPLITDEGMAGEYIRGAFWVNYTFRVSSPKLSKDKFEKGVIPYLQYFEVKQPRKLDAGHYVFYVKEIDIPKNWEKDFLKKQVNEPWTEAGTFDGESFIWTEQMLEIFEGESLK